ncbi:hypothetical protein RDI58_001229 [Solanum bulbocastanum]|uniref:C2H2-type domain-containing protein n=1 Tax=Solanum bulbocastanum TaxID=147425 RepID=A0AAN8YPS4_SOLBU
MQQQPPTSRMDYQGIMQNPEGLWCYRCATCRDGFISSQESYDVQASHTSWMPKGSFVPTTVSHGALGASCCCTCTYHSSTYL